MKLLIIPDAHAHPKHDNDRFTWLGRLILAEKPDTVLCLGDFADMCSLGRFDRGKLSFEGRRYQDDVEVAVDAQEKLWAPYLNWKKKRKQKALWSPRRIMCVGNHEARILGVAQERPELNGVYKMEDLKFHEYWDEVHPFLSRPKVAGFIVSHYFASGVNGRPIGGVNQGRAMVQKLHKSTIAGHSHVLSHAMDTAPDGDRIHGISAGCYVHYDFEEHALWCAASRHMWWRGVIIMDGAHAGDYTDYREISMQHIEELYS